MKTCNSCGVTKSVAEFYRNRGMRDGLLKQCKVCTDKRVAAYNRHVTRDKRWYALKARSSARYRKRNPELVRRKLREWRARNPDKVAANHSRRHARRYNTESAFTAAEFREKYALLGNVCFYCGEAKPLGPDHKLPLARGGSNDITNIVPACVSCNHHKSVRTAQEYIAVRLAEEVSL